MDYMAKQWTGLFHLLWIAPFLLRIADGLNCELRADLIWKEVFVFRLLMDLLRFYFPFDNHIRHRDKFCFSFFKLVEDFRQGDRRLRSGIGGVK